MTYTKLYPRLLEARLIGPTPMGELKPPYPDWYKLDAHYVYHAGAIGHDVENRIAFKRKVQALKSTHWLDFATLSNSLNVKNNPLLEYSNNIFASTSEARITKMSQVQMQREQLFQFLLKYGYLLTKSAIQGEEGMKQ